MSSARRTGAAAVLAAALATLGPAAGTAAALSCSGETTPVESAVERFRAHDVVFVGYKERALVGFDQYVVLEVYKGDLGRRALVAEGIYGGGPDGGPPALIRGDDPRGLGDVTRQGPCPLMVRDAGGASVDDDEVARLAFGDPHAPGTTATSLWLTLTEYPLRWLSGWRVWAVLAGFLVLIAGVREYRARTR